MDLTNPFAVVDFLLSRKNFPFSEDEKRILNTVKGRSYSGESTCVQDLSDLRCLYWQVVGFERSSESRRDAETTKKHKPTTPPIEYDEDSGMRR